LATYAGDNGEQIQLPHAMRTDEAVVYDAHEANLSTSKLARPFNKRRLDMTRFKRIPLTLTAIACLAVTAGAVAQDRPASLTVATASPGGVFAIYGEGLAGIITKATGVKASTRQTQGPSQNLVLVQSGQAEVGMTTSGPAYEALNGVLDLKPGDKHTKVRALFAMYPTPFQMIALKESGITKMEDFAGKRIGAGPRAGTGGTYWPRWLNTLGINANIQFGAIGDQASQMTDGRLDAIVTAAGVPQPAMSEIETTASSVIFGMSPKTLEGILKANPYAVEFTIPKGSYKSLTSDIKTAAMWNFAIASSDMSEKLAYDIVKAVFDNHADLVKTHSTAKDTLPENIVKNTVVPLHPGAVRYYREKGIKIPDSLLPPEMKK
jgi:TRAP transporter TAXI family solute receptor